MKKYLILLILVLVFMAGCNAEESGGQGSDDETTGETPTVGIAMPTQSSERWVDDGNNMVEMFEDLGYETNLQYAEDVVENQLSQIENMITQGVDILVIASIDGEALTDVLDQAQNLDIPVIAYDRLIMNHEHVSYYVTFDNFQVGVLQGEYIEEKLGLAEGEGPFNIELFGGSPDDNNAYFFWDGAMSILQPYIDDEQLIVRSGQTEFSQGATLRWSGSEAQERMDNLLSAHYSDEDIDVVYSPFDGISIGVVSSLKAVGYGTEDRPLPLITGQDAERPSIRSIVDGEQTQTIFKDTRLLAEQAVEMTKAIIADTEPNVNDTETYDNNVRVVPSYLIEPVSIDIDNYEEVLIDSGYYDEDEI
ncbi:multiple monosaccharide ABC transporter substrate-binding protein [Amphibacillus sp. Q70]|uniref:multiple monosaccharide ABC transporter substrate-binding protein n=1 Tax=Amphibacillus sp. Q70 TaxID=3453416 RepID=UPI003F83D6B1